MQLNQKFEFSVTQFAPVRAHQVAAMNFHLNETLNQFDKAYGKISTLNTPRHKEERFEFVRLIAQDLASDWVAMDGDIASLHTEAERIMPEIGTVRVWQQSTFE